MSQAVAVTFTARETAELLPFDIPAEVAADEIGGRALYSLISPGTELNQMYLAPAFPTFPGYATVFVVEQVGAEVNNVRLGELRLGHGTHRSWQQVKAANTLALPPGLSPDIAPIVRLMAVTMTTLVTTRARPGDRVMVTGAGPVGHLGAQIFQLAGYDVSVVEPDSYRRDCLQQAGLEQIFPAVPVDDPAWRKTVDLVVECSGHERAALDACRIVRPTGEIVLVGAPWQRHTDVNVQELLRLVFFNYLTLRSGWEWELPHRPDHFAAHSLDRTYATAAQWLAAGRLYVDSFIEMVVPQDIQAVYQDLLHGRRKQLFTMIDWNQG